jgi:lysophospholipase L1-like esterase
MTKTTRAALTLLACAAIVLPLAASADDGKKPEGDKPAAPESKWVKYYRERVEKFREENGKLDPSKKYACFVGDSLTEGFPLEKHFAGKPVLNRGIGSDVTGVLGQRGIIRRLDECVFDCHPSVAFIQIGTNDLAGSPKSPETFVEGVRDIVDAIQAKLPKLPIVLTVLYGKNPKYARWAELNPRIAKFNEGIVALATEKKLPFLDLAKAYNTAEGHIPDEITGDGLHLKASAYGKWAELARPYVP